MRNLVAAPVILLAVIMQSAIVSRIYLLSGIADLPLVMLAAWALQEEVNTAWQWAVATGLLVGFVSGIAWFVPVISYLIVVVFAQLLQKRVCYFAFVRCAPAAERYAGFACAARRFAEHASGDSGLCSHA